MLNKVCFYNNKVFLPISKDYDSYLVTYSYKKYLNSQKQNFHECFKIKIPLKCLYAKEIFLEVVDNFLTGIKCILILVFDLNGLNSVFVYCDAFRKKLHQVTIPELYVTGNVQPCSFFVSDGPSFLFLDDNTFHLYSLSSGVRNYFDRQCVFSDCKEYKFLQYKCFGQYISSIPNRMVFLLIISFDFASSQRIGFFGFISETSNGVIKCEEIPLTTFFPQTYEPVLKSVQVISSRPLIDMKTFCLKDCTWKENMCVLCTRDDCFIFSGGMLRYCCKLIIPIPDIMCIRTEFSGVSEKDINLVLRSENKTVYFISVKDKINCEVIKHLSDIQAVLFGDILMRGSKQVLLLKQTDIDLWQNNCILTDITSYMPIDLLSQNAMPDDCLKTTLSGLERKVQVGKTAIENVEQEISEKSAASVDALIRLYETRLNDECLKTTQTFQESLVDLILHGDENKKMDSSSSQSELSVKLLKEKKKFIDNHWIFCFCFINEGERPICYPSVKILLKGNQMHSIQKLFVHGCEEFSFNDKSSGHINPKTKFTVVVKFEFSTYQEEEQLFIILSWYDGSVNEFANEIFVNENQKVLVQQQLCLTRKITVNDLLNCELDKGISLPEDLLFIRASQQRMVLRISSQHSDISRMENILINSESPDLQLFQNSSLNCLIFTNEKSQLYGVHLIFHNLNERMVEIEAFTRNEKEILLLVHYLYRHLPEDILIFPCKRTDDEFSQIKKDAVCAMKSELDLLISSFNIHNISLELRKNYSELMSSQNAGTITIPKETYHRIQKALVKKECISDTLLKSFS